MSGRTPFNRLQALLRRKRWVDLRIAEEMRRPSPCNLMLQGLKRRRLALKDAVDRIRRRAATA